MLCVQTFDKFHFLHKLWIYASRDICLCIFGWTNTRKKKTIILKTSGDAIVSVLASSAVDFGFEPKSGQIKESKIDICCFSEKDATL